MQIAVFGCVDKINSVTCVKQIGSIIVFEICLLLYEYGQLLPVILGGLRSDAGAASSGCSGPCAYVDI